nr:hypothetical protein [Tanacetum cinerariifolium]
MKTGHENLRMLRIGLRLIPLVSKDDTTMMARCKTYWSFSSLRHCGVLSYSWVIFLFDSQELPFCLTKRSRNLKLRDEDGIFSIPDTELFENLTLMGDDALINGRSINEREAAAERISNDSEEIARVLTFMDAATVLAGRINVPTGSGFIPTGGPPAIVISTGSEVGPTASPIVLKRKGKEVMV